MTINEILDNCRELLDDKIQPYLWTDKELLSYLNRTISLFIRRTKILTDSTTIEDSAHSPICQIPIVGSDTGTGLVVLHPSIMEVVSARLASTDQPLDRQPRSYMDSRVLGWESSYSTTVTTMILDYQSRMIRLYPILNTAGGSDTLLLSVKRRPLTSFALSDLNTSPSLSPEFDAAYHYDMIDGMMSIAYLKNDAETYAPEKSKEHELRFEKWCEEVKRATIHLEHNDGEIAYPMRAFL